MGHHSYDSPFSSLDVCMFHFSLSLTLSFFSFSHSPHSVASSIYIFFLSFPFYPQYLGNFPSSCLCSCETVKKRRKKLCTILSSSNKTAAAAALLRIAKDDDDSLHTRVLLLFLWWLLLPAVLFAAAAAQSFVLLMSKMMTDALIASHCVNMELSTAVWECAKALRSEPWILFARARTHTLYEGKTVDDRKKCRRDLWNATITQITNIRSFGLAIHIMTWLCATVRRREFSPPSGLFNFIVLCTTNHNETYDFVWHSKFKFMCIHVCEQCTLWYRSASLRSPPLACICKLCVLLVCVVDLVHEAHVIESFSNSISDKRHTGCVQLHLLYV